MVDAAGGAGEVACGIAGAGAPKLLVGAAAGASKAEKGEAEEAAAGAAGSRVVVPNNPRRSASWSRKDEYLQA